MKGALGGLGLALAITVAVTSADSAPAARTADRCPVTIRRTRASALQASTTAVGTSERTSPGGTACSAPEEAQDGSYQSRRLDPCEGRLVARAAGIPRHHGAKARRLGTPDAFQCRRRLRAAGLPTERPHLSDRWLLAGRRQTPARPTSVGRKGPEALDTSARTACSHDGRDLASIAPTAARPARGPRPHSG